MIPLMQDLRLDWRWPLATAFFSPHLAHARRNVDLLVGADPEVAAIGIATPGKPSIQRREQALGQKPAAGTVDVAIAVPVLLRDVVTQRRNE